MRAERIEEAAGALLAASSRIEAETMCVVPRRLVDALRAALALPADAPAQPAPEGAGEAGGLGDEQSCVDAEFFNALCPTCLERVRAHIIATTPAVTPQMQAVIDTHPTPRAEAASAEASTVDSGHPFGPSMACPCRSCHAAFAGCDEPSEAPASAEAVAREALQHFVSPHLLTDAARAVAHALRGGGA